MCTTGQGATGSINGCPMRSLGPIWEDVVQLVALAASTINEMVKRNNAFVSAASRTVARLHLNVTAAFAL
ncbi:MAG: hypothetical protein JWM36_2579 [Hyphomicrobiales bacterium]|nr:hypothetical protein [Hyphomicrobiales bacterium]